MSFGDEILDYKVTKKVYPQHNLSETLEFKFDKDPILCFRKNKILIRGWVKLSD